MDGTLLPCPFCGKVDGVVVRHYPGIGCSTVECDDELGGCGVEGPSDADSDAAVLRWNTRATTEGGISDRLLLLASDISDVAEDFRLLAQSLPTKGVK